jgi:phage anti-repressor protein
MLRVNDNNRVDAREIYNFIEVKSRFNDWFKSSIDFIDAKEGKDFYYKSSKSTGGRPTIEYDVSIDCAKELCLIQRNEKSKKLRLWLISLSNQVESAGLVSHKQVLEIVRMIKVFSVYEHRKLALNKNVDNYISNALMIHPEYSENRNVLYKKFHQWRNEVLQTGKEVLSERVKEYCLVERKRIPAKFTQDEALTLMGEYEQIKNAIWDLLCSQNKSDEMINNICNLAQDLAKEMKPFMERLNQSNLFFKSVEDKEVKAILQ